MNIRIVPFKNEYKDDFVELTKMWLNEYFWIEPCDEELFADPAAAYIETGGDILVALDVDNNAVAGVCALVFHAQENNWEMSKLGVYPQYRHNGIAERLVDATIEIAKSKGVEKLFLDTSIRLEAAVRLYRRKGFVDVPLTHSHYQRTDMQMMKVLTEQSDEHCVL